MPGTDRALAPPRVAIGAHRPRLRLVLPRAQLDAMLAQALSGARTQPAGAVSPWLAHAPLTFQPGPDETAVLAGRFRAGPVGRPFDLRGPDPDGVVVLAIVSGAARPPLDGAAWERWMQQHAPGFRLGTPALSPALAVLWLRTDGVAAAACRRSDWSGIDRPQGALAPAAGGRWRAFDGMSLPGAGMLELDLGVPAPQGRIAEPDPSGARGREDPAPAHDASASEVTSGRYSRLAGGLGDSVLARLQRSRVALVGLGRTGSTLAHSLARMGTSLLLFDPDAMELHNLDGDLPPLFEGRPKAEAAARFVRGLMRPGAELDARALPVASPVAGSLLAGTDVIVSCVDNDAARLWASLWALALNKPHLDIATGLHAHGAEADLRLIPPGTGCLACRGGFAQRGRLALQWSDPLPPPTPADFRQQRPGSLRSWGVMSAHAGLRMLEHMYAGRIGHALFRRLAETADGGLQVQDDVTTIEHAPPCALCASLAGRGARAVELGRLRPIVEAALR